MRGNAECEDLEMLPDKIPHTNLTHTLHTLLPHATPLPLPRPLAACPGPSPGLCWVLEWVLEWVLGVGEGLGADLGAGVGVGVSSGAVLLLYPAPAPAALVQSPPTTPQECAGPMLGSRQGS
ncbi:hypothetical protein O3P69_015536 [Scylla paramamosain]|uniref:Uncharacterized protein n=1 Tax=Scylla paramamosain TaxID=85552 RepID=A0AAW0SCY9_SCYPA